MYSTIIVDKKDRPIGHRDSKICLHRGQLNKFT